MRLLALILTVTVTGPSVASLVCDWACAAKHQIVASSGACHEVSPAPKTVLTTTSQAISVVAR